MIDFGASFNWLTVLKALCAGEELGPGDAFRLILRSGHWPTCACGQLCSSLPRAEFGPEDYWLRKLGLQFHSNVSGQRWVAALEIFRQIEERAARLLAEQESLAPLGVTAVLAHFERELAPEVTV